MAFCLTAREIAATSRSSFRPEANPTRQLTGLRPKPELQPKQQRPERKRLRPEPKPPELRPMQQQPVPKQRRSQQQPEPKQQLHR